MSENHGSGDRDVGGEGSKERTVRHPPHGFRLGDGFVIEEPRRLPLRHRCQVLVCGAGPAGVGAALAAAREGADVILLERWAMAGGMWTAGLVNPFFEWREKGFLVAELIARLESAGAWKLWVKDYCFDPEAMKLTLETMLAEAGVELLYYTLAVDAIRCGDRVRGAVIESKAGREAILADVVIDASGDGDLAARAGCEFRFGSPVDGFVQPMTLMFEIDPIHGLRHRNSGELYDWLRAAIEATGSDFELPFPRYSAAPYVITLPCDAGGAVQATHVYRLNPLDPADLTGATVATRRQAHELTRLLRTMPPFRDVRITATAPAIGLRESRRIIGCATLTRDDLAAGRRFEDAVCAVRFGVDIHRAAGAGTTPDPAHGIRMRPYEIPFRCLLPRDVRGLLLAGRCISGDHYAHASYRVTGSMMATGQAAGLAAAWAVGQGCDPADIDGRRLRRVLAERGCRFLPDDA
ncbi:MAG: FAD-dependent oxidoreductase [Lentisphaeria bacterium]|nr:FAD-dependent oxidoreductase [Lentisphaeria bacterium]